MAEFNNFVFQSGFKEAIMGLIALKHGLGLEYYGPAVVLKRFDNFCAGHHPEQTILSKELVLDWFSLCRSGKPKTIRLSMTPVSHLGTYLCNMGIAAYVFPVNTLPPDHRYTPHIYSMDELQRFFAATDDCRYIDLLLLADESEYMIDKYLECGEMFVLNDNGVKAECVVTKEADGIYELKNIAVMPDCQRKGYGKKLIDFLFSHYTDCNVMLVGTGDVPSSLSFYQKCGFIESHRIHNFFTDNYDHPMFEDGKQLVDMVYLKRER